MFNRLMATAAAVLLLATVGQAQSVRTFPPAKPYHTPKQPIFVPPVYKVPVYKPPVFYPPVVFPPVYRPPVYNPPCFPYSPKHPWYGW